MSTPDKPDKAETMRRLTAAFKKAIADGNVDVQHLGVDLASIKELLAKAPTENFALAVQASGGGEEAAAIADRIIEAADEETLDAMATLTSDELEEVLRSVLIG